MPAQNDVSGDLEDLQLTLGEGPSFDAWRDRRPVVEADLASPASHRWLAFPIAAVALGARAAFAFPLEAHRVAVGTMLLYRDRPGPLSDSQHADASRVAERAAQTLLTMLGDGRDRWGHDMSAHGLDRHLVVHQASGMVAARLDVSAAEALARLRVRAYANDQTLVATAEDVVARRLLFARSRSGRL